VGHVLRKTGRQVQITATPPDAAVPSLRCESCDSLLTFIYVVIGGVEPLEHWYRYMCHRCRTAYEYRRRTRKLRRIA
jgi:hypothetical protein